MLTDREKTTALEIVLSSHDPEEFGAVNDRLCREFPSIQTEDLVALWREAGERQLDEAEALMKAHGGGPKSRPIRAPDYRCPIVARGVAKFRPGVKGR